MPLGEFLKRSSQARSKVQLPSRSVVAHKSFVPLLTVWGAALLGGALLVVPASATLAFATKVGLGSLGGLAKFVLALIGAIAGGGLAFLAATAFQKRVAGGNAFEGELEPIDPSTELGSESLDEPIEQLPFGAEEEQTVELTDVLEQASQEVEEPQRRRSISNLVGGGGDTAHEESSEDELVLTKPSQDVEAVEPCVEDPKPREVDLAEFAALPGRNAVWVEEPSEKPASQTQEDVEAPALPLASVAAPAKSALERLRERPTGELSLVEMVERFAGALHERQEAERERHPNGGPKRDPALAEALKALAMFNEDGFDVGALTNPDPDIATAELSRTEQELRAALSKLQNLRGAA